ncbi:MAG: extracellular solute-binding protein [Chloroflexi bacterium]|nr:extracellular solute-binding protein [Chloroflexota bacterium]
MSPQPTLSPVPAAASPQHSRAWMLLASAFLALLGLAGCSFGVDKVPFWGAQPTPTPPYRTVTALLPDEPVNERIRQYDFERLDLLVDMTIEPAYSANLRGALESDSPPDLVVVDSFAFPDLAAADLLLPAGDRLGPVDDFYPLLAEAFVWQEERYCLPREVRTLALVYNQAQFAKAGLQPPRTWQEMRAAAEAVTDLNIGSFGLIVTPDLSRWLPFLYQAGGAVVDGAGQVLIDSPAAAAAIDFPLTLFRDNFAGQPAESNSGWAGEVMGKGKGGMAVEGNWIAPYLAAEFPKFAYAIAPLPSGPGGRGTVAFTSCYAVSARSANPEDAFALAVHLTSPELQQEWPADGAWMPTRISLREAWLADFPALAPFLTGLDQAHVWQFPPGYATFLESFNRGMLTLLAADIEAADFLAQMQRTAEGIGD